MFAGRLRGGLVNVKRSRTLARRVVTGSLTVALVAGGLALGPAAWATTFNVNCGTGGDLQSKLDTVPSGSTILIEGTCRGNFTISGRSLTLKGNPSATLDGMDAGRTLGETGPSYALHLVHLTVTGGAGVTAGAGIVSQGPLTLNKVTVTGNEASASAGVAAGGGIDASMGVTITSSTISSNRATAVGNGAAAEGGGIITDGNLTITGSVVSGNHATASSPSGIAMAVGGGVDVGVTLTLTNTKLIDNRVEGDGDGAHVHGAAAYVSSSGAASSLTGAVATGNTAAAVATTPNHP